MVFSNWPLVIDLRTGAFSGGSGETAVLNAASAQLSNWLGLPSGVACSMTDAKAIDAQYGVEKGITSLAAALAGGNLIYESSGMTASLLGASFEAFVLDDEMHSHTYRALRGIEVTEDNLGFDAICEAVTGRRAFSGRTTHLCRDGAGLFLPLAGRPDRTAHMGRDGCARMPGPWPRSRAHGDSGQPSPDLSDATSKIRVIRAKFNILV